MAKITQSKIQYTWDLKEFYSSAKDPKILSDIKEYEEQCIRFEKKYKKSKSYLTNELALKKVLDEHELLTHNTLSLKPYVYLKLLKDTESDSDGAVESLLNMVLETIAHADNRITFLKLSLGSISKSQQKKFLQSKTLIKYRYQLSDLFDHAKYFLTEPEEKILKLKSQPSSGLWVSGVAKQLNKITIQFKGKEIPLSAATSILKGLPRTQRVALDGLIKSKLELVADFAESELNAICINKKINDSLRGYKTPEESIILGYENDPVVIDTLIRTVTKHFPIAHRFYTLKAKHLKLEKLSYVDRNAEVGNIQKKISIEEAYSIISNVFAKLNPHFTEILNTYAENGQIDVFPRKNKASGAYCWTLPLLETRVLLNHTDDFNSVSTFTHEMGHAIHGEYSKNQPLTYQGHSMSVAEVASTLFETFVFEDSFSQLSDKEKLVALHNKIQDDIQTIFRQVACYNFEHELHMTIREKGSMTKEQMCLLMNKHMKAYCGPIFDFEEKDGLSFVSWSHIRRFFYVYSYAYGQLISKALYNEYKKDTKYMDKIIEFLSAGKSKSPEDIFEDAGIAIRDPKFFEIGIKQIKKDIDLYESLLTRVS